MEGEICSDYLQVGRITGKATQLRDPSPRDLAPLDVRLEAIEPGAAAEGAAVAQV
jgi:hypothetical protein